MPRRWPRGALPLLVLLLALPTPTAARTFVIERFAVTLEVRPDASLRVQETLTIAFHGRHQGVFRLIPVRYLRHGAEFALRLDDVTVLDDAHQPLRTEVAYPGRYARIKAWVPGAENATRTVHILYRVRRGLLAFDDHDELYWNVTGDEWEAPIHEVEARVTVAGSAAVGPLQALAYTGPRGATGADYVEERRDDGVVFRTTRALRPREGLTIVVGWPPGVVARPSAWQQGWWVAVDHWPLALPLLTLGAMSLVWRAYGRDPASNRSIKPEYGPPPGLAPAEAGALIDERAEPRDVVATLVDLAVRGYLHIERPDADGRDFLFRRVKPLADDPTLTPIERFVLQKVFGEQLTLRERSLSDLRRNYDYVFGPIRDAIYRALVERRLVPASPYWIRQGWGAMGVVLLFVAAALLIELDRFAPLGWPLPAGVAVSGALLLAFARIMPRRTWRGVRLLTHLRGFQEFLERAEKDRLERLPGDTVHRWLPWAIALGVSERWIFNWQGLRVEAPAWYDGRAPFTLPGYSRDLDAFGRQNEEALRTGRRAGGWSGGAAGGTSGFSRGSSGGGFGGGGGGTF